MTSRLLLALPLLVLAAGWGRDAANAGDTATLQAVFQRSNQAYREGRYQDALDGYRQVLRARGDNGNLHYNMGNAAFRLNRPGQAILSYERARRLIPRDADLRFNLGHVRDQLRDVLPPSESISGAAFFWVDSLTAAELFRAFAVCNALLWALLTLRLFRRREWTYHVLLILLAAWALAGASFGAKWHQLRSDDWAVILHEEVSVLAGPDDRDSVLFKLHEGTLVHHERAEDGWALVRLGEDKRGWVRAEALEKVLPGVTSPGAVSPG